MKIIVPILLIGFSITTISIFAYVINRSNKNYRQAEILNNRADSFRHETQKIHIRAVMRKSKSDAKAAIERFQLQEKLIKMRKLSTSDFPLIYRKILSGDSLTQAVGERELARLDSCIKAIYK